mmetsp:Transcript_33496/g.56182  ORF Transcript_33496/g.56182 Transcript_33496/m.56182 type:complete len:401 (+) Transcript_33496:40-1242(+)|eukprot:CAMPEP_0174983092 /NCGR_PEP_ID=MMETSP0004_2-20121128/16919_1 /TAXON_ID=420556 /ORGANISM="Ochromonas sp., Strain CCMP1393" /LENGTH=400 /DNA_ID=CAMNT_0016235241 /DNA_START=27 /DNA_END=1229 /DNA_ORIENTATION=+
MAEQKQVVIAENAVDEFLTADMVRKGLKRMGRHPTTLQHAFLELSLADRGVNNIDYLSQYPHIMYLDVSKNRLCSLKILAKLPSLVQLNASGNSITECLDFSAPLCSLAHAWGTGHDSAGSLLTKVDLSDNKIARIIDLKDHRFLEELNLHHNDISIIEGLYSLKYLQKLDLSNNSIEVIEGLDGLPIKELYLRSNQIKEVTGLNNLPHLSVLDVSDNRITSIEPLTCNVNITRLDVSVNNIEIIRQTEYLQTFPWLTHLNLFDNPGSQKEFYRLRVLYRLPHILVLDNEDASREAKVRAFNLYRAPEGDLDMRKEVLAKHLPNVEFVDYSPQQLEHDEETDLTAEELKGGNFISPPEFYEDSVPSVSNMEQQQPEKDQEEVAAAESINELSPTTRPSTG